MFFLRFATSRVPVYPVLAPVIAHIMLVECVVLVSPPLHLLTYTGPFSLPHHVCVCVCMLKRTHFSFLPACQKHIRVQRCVRMYLINELQSTRRFLSNGYHSVTKSCFLFVSRHPVYLCTPFSLQLSQISCWWSALYWCHRRCTC